MATLSMYIYKNEYSFCDHNLRYINSFSPGGGGPSASSLEIDGVKIPKHYFGGPPFFYKKYAFLPCLGSGAFHPSIINLEDKTVHVFKGVFYPYVLFYKVEDDYMHFYIDEENLVSRSLAISKTTKD
jgi:hypothetical protein